MKWYKTDFGGTNSSVSSNIMLPVYLFIYLLLMPINHMLTNTVKVPMSICYMYVCTCECVYVCMYVPMYVCMYVRLSMPL